MGEAKSREEAIKKQQEEFQQMLNTPLTQEEANALIARIDMQKAQLAVIRLQLAEKVTNVEAQIAQAEYDRTIVIHRALLAAKPVDESPKATMGEPVGGKAD